MRKLILILTIVFGIVICAQAQDAGQIWVGGSIGFKTSKTSNLNRLNNYNIMPEMGYVVSENLGVGIRLGYIHEETNIYITDVNGITSGTAKSNGFAVNPFVRCSFLKGDIGSMFIDGGVGYEYSKYKGSDEKKHEMEVGFRPGVAIKVSDRVALTGKYGFLGYEYEKAGDEKTNTFGFDFDFRQAQFGVNLIF